MNNKKEYILTYMSYFGIVITSFPIIVAAIFLFPSADDFTNTNAVLSLGGNIISNTLAMTKSTYMGWQGTYFSLLIMYFFSNIIEGRIWGYRLFCIINIILLLLSIFYLNFIVLQNVVKEKKNYVINTVFNIIVIMITLGHYVDETLYWYTGVCVYTLPLTCAIGGFIYLVKYNITQKKISVYISGILIFCAVGGALQITALTCGILLGFVLITWKQKNRVNMYIFIIGMTGAFINLLTPGYYARHESLDEEYRIVRAVFSSYESVMNAIKMHLLSNVTLLCLIVLIICGYFWGKNKKLEISLKQITGVFIYLGIGMIIVDFPVYLGYGVYFPSRCLFIENIVVSVFLITMCILIGIWMSKIINIHQYIKKIVVILAVVIVISGTRNTKFEIINYPIINIWKNLGNGNIAKYVQDNENLFERFNSEVGGDIVISESPDCMGIYPPIGIYQDPNMWTNMAISQFYSVNTIRLE